MIGGGSGVGTVFELSPPVNHHGAWTETTIHTFACGSDGCHPWAGLTMDRKGTFYGTTQFGGLPSNGGTVFELKQLGGIWTEGVVFSFKYSNNQLSAAGLLLARVGHALRYDHRQRNECRHGFQTPTMMMLEKTGGPAIRIHRAGGNYSGFRSAAGYARSRISGVRLRTL